jgi:hypothetical protein
LTFAVESSAVLAERLPARALPQVLRFDVVTFGALRVVVMHRLLD